MPSTEHPRRRRTELIVEESGDELLVYDKGNDHAHRLNRTAVIVWRHCDGHRSVADLAAALAAEIGEVADEDLARIALDDLARAGLLENAEPRHETESQLSRRRFVKRAGAVAAAAAALPVVASIVAPEPAAAQSQIDTPTDGVNTVGG